MMNSDKEQTLGEIDRAKSGSNYLSVPDQGLPDREVSPDNPSGQQIPYIPIIVGLAVLIILTRR